MSEANVKIHTLLNKIWAYFAEIVYLDKFLDIFHDELHHVYLDKLPSKLVQAVSSLSLKQLDLYNVARILISNLP